MPDVLLRKGNIELDRRDLDGAHIRFDDIPERPILVAKSGQPYALNETLYGTEGIIRDFSVWPVEIQITGRSVHHEYHPYGGAYKSLRIKVFFPSDFTDDRDGSLGLLIFGDNERRLESIEARENLTYRVRPRIENVEEFGI